MFARKNFYVTFISCFALLLAVTLLFACAPAGQDGDGANDKMHTEITLDIGAAK